MKVGLFMTIKKIPTSRLLQQLFKTRNIASFISHFNEEPEHTSFAAHLNCLCNERGLIPSQIIHKSAIERSYGHQIFNGRRIASRDKVIQLAFGFGMDYENAQDLLKAARKNPLYVKVKRDAVIIYALNRGYSLVDVQITLADLNLTILGKE
jgi:hypothetical protein